MKLLLLQQVKWCVHCSTRMRILFWD